MKTEPESASSSSYSESHADSEASSYEEEEKEQPRRKRSRTVSNNGVGERENPGRRIIAGRLYDSDKGVSCHWCRQKRDEDHVACTRPGCRNNFCGSCLANRHGESIREEAEAGGWVCPKCRGDGKGCGKGCRGCCNCGRCRKSRGEKPTGTIMPEARRHGFYNAHDWLVHLVTRESAQEIASRKNGKNWTKGDGTAKWVKFQAPRVVENGTPTYRSYAQAPKSRSSGRTCMRGALKGLTESSPRFMASQRVKHKKTLKRVCRVLNDFAQVVEVKSEWEDTDADFISRMSKQHTNTEAVAIRYVKKEEEDGGYISVEESEVHPFQKAPETFRELLQKELDRPFDAMELAVLQQQAEFRKPKQKTIQTRHQVHVVDTNEEGKSFMDYHPDFQNAVQSVVTPGDKLRYFRGFFLWLQCGVTDENGFKPWVTQSLHANCDDCFEVDGVECEITQEVISLERKRLPRMRVKVKDEVVEESCQDSSSQVGLKVNPEGRQQICAMNMALPFTGS